MNSCAERGLGLAFLIILILLFAGAVLGNIAIREPLGENTLVLEIPVEEPFQDIHYVKIAYISLVENSSRIVLHAKDGRVSQSFPLSQEEQQILKRFSKSINEFSPIEIHVPDYIQSLLPHSQEELYSYMLLQLDPTCHARLVSNNNNLFICTQIGSAYIVRLLQFLRFPEAGIVRLYAHKSLFAPLEKL